MSDNSREPKSIQTESPRNDNEGNPERNYKNDTVNTDREKNKSTEPEQDSVEKSQIKNENYINKTQTIDQPASMQPSQSSSSQFSKTNDEDFEFSIDHITSMVANLADDESDEEEWARREELNQQHAKSAPPPNASQQNMDPSILYVKKAEPGKNIDGLQDWIYRDPQGEIQGLYFYIHFSY